MTTISAESILLRPPRPDDTQRLTLLANNKKIYDNLRDVFPHPYKEKDAEYFIGMCMKENPPVTFAIEYKGEFAGMIGLVPQQDVYRRTAEIGYWLGEPYRNKGIATAAVNLIVDYGFKKLKLVRIHTGVFDHNKGSQRVLEKCGFTLEAIFKKSVIKNGKILDEYRYAKLNEQIENLSLTD